MAGPFQKTISRDVDSDKQREYYLNRVWYRQQAPFKNPLKFEFQNFRLLEGNYQIDAASWARVSIAQKQSALLLRARDKLRGQLSERAQLGAAVAEAQSSIDMIADRAFQMIDYVQSVRTRRSSPAGKARLRRIRRQREVSLARGKASDFLEGHLGWEPMIKDIFAACDAIQQPIPLGRYHVRAATTQKTVNRNSGPYWNQTTIHQHLEYRLTTFARVSNPNLWLANSLGLVNPASVAWELVPLSFVWNWFQPVGSFLDQLGQFAGLQLVGPCTTFGEICTESRIAYTGKYVTKEGFWLTRDLGIPTASLPKPQIPQLSPWRAATAVALLTQQLKSLGDLPLK